MVTTLERKAEKARVCKANLLTVRSRDRHANGYTTYQIKSGDVYTVTLNPEGKACGCDRGNERCEGFFYYKRCKHTGLAEAHEAVLKSDIKQHIEDEQYRSCPCCGGRTKKQSGLCGRCLDF